MWQSDYFDDKKRFADMINGAMFKGEQIVKEKELKPFVINHKLNLFDYHDYEDFSQFKTDNRFMFELLSNSKDEEKTGEIIKEYLKDDSLDEESFKAILGILDIKIDINKYKKKTKKGVKYSMCKAWDDHRESGRQEGKQETIKISLKVLVNSLKKFSTDLETIYNTVVENDLYSDITKEQVMEYYYAK